MSSLDSKPAVTYFSPAERATREELDQVQSTKLKRLLEYAYNRSPFYRRQFDLAGVRPDKLRNLSDFQKYVPVVSKEDMLEDQERNPPFGDRLCVDPREIVQVNVTGGTSGKGQEVHALTVGDVAMTNLAYAHGCYWAGVRRQDTVADTFPVSMSAGGLWLNGAYIRQHANLLLMGTYPTSLKLKYLKLFQPRVLTATPSYLLGLRSAAESELGLNPATDLNVEVLLTATEHYTLERAREIEQGWGAKMFEWYASTQRLLTSTCEYGAVWDGKFGVLHHYPHLSLIETLDRDTREPVGHGEEGEVVVTFLDSEASPLIRFAMGDKAELVPHYDCPCGRPFDGYRCGSISRYDDMLKVRGVNFWPATADEVIFKYPEVANYSGVVTSRSDGREDLLVSVEFRREAPVESRPSILSRIGKDLHDTVGLNMSVRESPEALPTGMDFQAKLRRWRDERTK